LKLLMCLKCGDIFNVRMRNIKSCSCGATKGVYTDNLNAQYAGADAVPLGFNNHSLARAILHGKPTTSKGTNFEAFMIAEDAPTYKKVDQL
jgi:hypothetical protein